MSDEKENSCNLFDLRTWIPEFLIDDEKRAALCFRETLIIYSKDEPERNAKPIGSYCILVEPFGPRGQEFFIHAQSSMSINGHFCGSKVTGTATSKFHCLEEKRSGFLDCHGVHEKEIFIGMKSDNYYVKLTSICPCDRTTKTKNLSFCSNNKLISDGVNILLIRYLAIMDYEGTLSFQNITIDGDLVALCYICSPKERMEMDGRFTDVYTVECKLCKEDGTVQFNRTYLAPNGRVLRCNCSDEPYILKINPLDDLKTHKTLKIEVPLRERWREDIEIFSKYLDFKYSKTAEQTEYLADHPELKQLIGDYVQTLLVGNQPQNWNNITSVLLRQPENVLDFTIQHFKAFSKNPIAWEETSASDENNEIDIKSQLAEEKSSTVCNICGFSIDCSALVESPKSSAEECHEMISPRNSVQSTATNCSSSSASDTKGKDNGLNEMCPKNEDDVSDVPLMLKKSCDIYRPSLEHPECFGTFRVCTKCSAVDRILQKLKH